MEVENVPVRKRNLGEVSTRRVHDALGLGRGAGGVEDEQQILGLHVLRLERGARRLLGHDLVVPDVAAFGHGDVGVAAVHDDDRVDRWTIDERGVDMNLQRAGRTAPITGVGGDHGRGFGVVDPVAERVRGETAEHHRVRRSDAGAGEHGHGGLGDHRHVDGDPVAALDPSSSERGREALHLVEEVGIRDSSRVTGFALEVIRNPPAEPTGDVAVQTVRGDVQLSVFEPPGERKLPVEDLGERLRPRDELTCLSGPERLPVGVSLIVESAVVQH